MTISGPDAERPLTNTIKMVWATSIAHMFYANPQVKINIPISLAPYISIISSFMFLLIYGIGGFIIWVLANGITKGERWARATFIVFVFLSLPTRVSSLFYSNSMFDGAKFQLMFFIILFWCIADVFLAYLLCSPAEEERPEMST
jgi:hypothetical protein